MFQRCLPVLWITLIATLAIAQESKTDADVTVSATIEWTENSNADLVVTAKIADGLHIYAQSQPKPFLASKIDVTAQSDQVAFIGDFTADRQPIRLDHESLGVELHQYEGTVQWRAPIKFNMDSLNRGDDLGSTASKIQVDGTVFAQACEADRCFAPNTYSFTAVADLPTDAATTTSGQTSNIARHASQDTATPTVSAGENLAKTNSAAFSLSDLKVESKQNQSAWSVIPLAFVAGLLLNFMPCVLPVVGLKLLSFVQQANSDRKQILLMNLAYTAGLLSVMLILATLAVFAGLGWGEQFSSPVFTVTLSAIVFAFGLSFLGVWEIPLPGFIGAAGGKTKQEGYVGAFVKGILSTLLATPCSGPFLGAALAWAVSQPTYLTYSVFAAVGLGMASPYIVVGLFPSMIRFLPKPGNWMVTFKQVMGFIMLATVVYLMSFMPVAFVVPTVLLMLGIGVAVWYASRTPGYAPAPQRAKAWGIAGGMIVATALFSFGWLADVMQSRFERAVDRFVARQTISGSPSISMVKSTGVSRDIASDHVQWQVYSPELFESIIRAGKPVFVDFTADWCLTCKANEVSAIETTAVAAALRQTGTVALRADKTESNPAVDELLRKLGNSAASIPFYAVFPANRPGEPILLDGVFASPEPFVEALTRDNTISDASLVIEEVSYRAE